MHLQGRRKKNLRIRRRRAEPFFAEQTKGWNYYYMDTFYLSLSRLFAC